MSEVFGRLDDVPALICGASAGIGLASAQLLALMGARVTLLARNESSLQKALTSLDQPERHQFVCADMCEPSKAIQAIESLEPFQILINNSAGPPPGSISSANAEQFLDCFRQHLLGTHVLTQYLLPGMRAAKFGRIVNIISTSVKEPIAGLGVSNSIRAAVANWAKTLAGEVATYGITVNNVLPGYTKTGRLEIILEKKSQQSGLSTDQVLSNMLEEVPMRRTADAAEIAAAVTFLCSKSASYITGINLPVDGGRTRSL